jgi:multidrug efflux pump subunit AcrA (membrane-fusion protein)
MKSESSKVMFKRLLFIIPVIIAVAIVVMLVKSRKGPERLAAEERAQTVRVIKLVTTDVTPRAIGYGYVKPGQVWQAVAEVSGKIVEVSPAFKTGNFAKAGSVLVRIDPAAYKLAVAQMEANIEEMQAQIDQLNSQAKNLQTSLEIEKAALKLNKTNMERNKSALADNSVSYLQYEQTQLSYQAQLAKVQNLENELNLIPSNKKALEAGLAMNRAKLEDAHLNLKNTDITVPFNSRITGTSAEIGQFVQKGQTIATADGTGIAEIAAQIPMNKMANLLRSVERKPMATTDRDMEMITKRFGLQVKVRLPDENFKAEWEARFARADAAIDAQTRTFGAIVAVDDPYKKIITGVRPPLVRNMYCEVEISGRIIPDTIVIPRAAIHDEFVFLVNSESRLERRKVIVDFPQTDFYVIKQGLKPEEMLVVSDLVPAIEGMLLITREDKNLSERLMASAAGRSEIK